MSLSLFSLEGKIALITGGNGGLGRAIALGLRSVGATVIVTGRNSEKNDAISRELGDSGAVFALDVRKEGEVQNTVEKVVAQFGQLDILVNNAGIFRGGSVMDMSQEDWDAVIGTHLTGSFFCAKHVAKAMANQNQNKGGKIINIGSMYSLFGAPLSIDYGSAKAGILGLTRSLAVELAPYNIQVNAILPGWYETDLTKGLPMTPRGEQIRRKTPAGRWGEMEDLIGASVFLASEASNFVTGVGISVDGGYSIAERLLTSD